mmetsp:Transcript_47314/g.137793  ORF Transcript_47314/g.137793 Transcript_47314/m.137793 type:complete len:418 (-) Transcript_47314:312-1565(-)
MIAATASAAAEPGGYDFGHPSLYDLLYGGGVQPHSLADGYGLDASAQYACMPTSSPLAAMNSEEERMFAVAYASFLASAHMGGGGGDGGGLFGDGIGRMPMAPAPLVPTGPPAPDLSTRQPLEWEGPPTAEPLDEQPGEMSTLEREIMRAVGLLAAAKSAPAAALEQLQLPPPAALGVERHMLQTPPSRASSLTTALTPPAPAQAPPAGTAASSKKGIVKPAMLRDPGVTTLMVRNIPLATTQRQFLEQLHIDGFRGSFDFVYLPCSFENRKNKGYGFVNFVDPAAMSRFYDVWHGTQIFGSGSGELPLNVSAASVQGLDANTKKWSARISRVRDPELRPYIVNVSAQMSVTKGGRGQDRVAKTQGAEAVAHVGPRQTAAGGAAAASAQPLPPPEVGLPPGLPSRIAAIEGSMPPGL